MCALATFSPMINFRTRHSTTFSATRPSVSTGRSRKTRSKGSMTESPQPRSRGMMKVSSRRAARSPSPATLAEEILGTRARQHAAELGEARADMLALLGRLVAIESPSSSREGVDGVADELAGLLNDAGFDLSRDPVPGHGDKVAAVRRFGQGPNVLILGHTDTVWPVGTLSHWPYRCSATAASGPGAGDMKSSLVMSTYALRLLSDRGPCGLGEGRFLLVPGK